MKLSALKSLLSQNIKKYRTEMGICQEKLAFLAGIDRTYMSEIERHLANPTIEVILKIANALDIPPEELIKGTKN